VLHKQDRRPEALGKLAEDVAQLLLRFGIVAEITTVAQSETHRHARDRDCYRVQVVDAEHQRTFCREIGAHGAWSAQVEEVRNQLAVIATSADLTPSKRSQSRARMAKVATVLHDERMADLATSDLYWDSVIAIESIGERPVYDATVLGTHNFIANGIVVHNSLEQDADMVILLHREDYYDANSDRPGEADLIVAKHRNGPTKTIPVAFQGHYSRFRDMGP